MCVCMSVYVRYAKLTKPYANLCIMRVFDKHTHRRMSRNTLEIVRLSTVFMVMCISVLWSMISLSYKKWVAIWLKPAANFVRALNG